MITIYATNEDYKKYGSSKLEEKELEKYLDTSVSYDVRQA